MLGARSGSSTSRGSGRRRTSLDAKPSATSEGPPRVEDRLQRRPLPARRPSEINGGNRWSSVSSLRSRFTSGGMGNGQPYAVTKARISVLLGVQEDDFA